MKSVNIHDAKTHFSSLISEVQAGEEVVIAKAGRPVARLVPASETTQRELGYDRDAKFSIAEDFDEYVPEELTGYV